MSSRKVKTLRNNQLHFSAGLSVGCIYAPVNSKICGYGSNHSVKKAKEDQLNDGSKDKKVDK